MTHFCTYFDSRYLSRGLALLRSLERVMDDFHLYILAFDETTRRYLEGMGHERVTVIPLDSFENDALRGVKPSRTRVEYFWTCTPALILHCLKRYRLSQVTYVDADLFFYSSPLPLVEEMSEASVLITAHRYTPRYDQTKRSGKYCVQFMSFKNDPDGTAVLSSWAASCLAWCHARVENGRFGDQKYLDEWPQTFRGVHELAHEGGGLAPWNIQQYRLILRPALPAAVEQRATGARFPVVFYHFHGIRFIYRDKVELSAYRLASEVIEFFYRPYLRLLLEIERTFPGTAASGAPGRAGAAARFGSELLVIAKRILRFRRYRIQSLAKLTGGRE